MAEVLRIADPEQAGRALTDVAVAAVEGAAAGGARRGRPRRARVDFAIIGMGRFGGQELGFGSDIDVMFVYEPRPGVDDEAASRAAAAIAEELRRLLMAPAATRRSTSTRTCGPRASRARSCARWARTRPTTSGGRPPGRRRRCCAPPSSPATRGWASAFMALVDPLRWIGPLTRRRAHEVRRLKARMESERLPRGADPNLHTKLGRGGLSDVEWVVQLLQMRHAARRPGAADDASTLEALEAARAGRPDRDGDAAELAAAWRMATAIRNAVMLVRGRPSDMVPIDVRELRAVAFVLGYPVGESGRMLEDYRRITRRARLVFERLFYGLEDDASPESRPSRERGARARRCGRPRPPTRRRTPRAAGRPPSVTSPTKNTRITSRPAPLHASPSAMTKPSTMSRTAQ